MEKDLVSIMVPFYNSEKHIKRCLHSIRKQTYKNVQIILIDDGSTDNTSKIIEECKQDFDDFYQFILLKKENGGAGSAINLALKEVSGEYLCWCDSDDELDCKNIEKKLNFLKKNKDYEMVMCFAKAYDEESGKCISKLNLDKDNQKDNMFEQLIYPGVPCYPGVFMIRTQTLFNRLNNRNISYNKNVGQNWQLLLPVAYKNRCGFINESLYNYYVRKDSHSHNTNYKLEIERTYDQEIILKNIMSFLSEKEKKDVFDYINKIIIEKRLNLSFVNLDKIEYNKNYKLLRHKKFKDFLKKIVLNFFIARILFQWYKKIKR